MAEAGVDISTHQSKTLDDLSGHQFDFVITVCGHADETCPPLPEHTRRIHMAFDDPPKLALNAANEEEALGHYRRVRDEIRYFVEHIDECLKTVA